MASANSASAVSFASGVTNLGGGDYEFILNADATNVSIDITGDSTLNLGPLTAGRQTFNIGTGSAFDINVSSDFAEFELLSDSTNLFTRFNRPAGIAAVKDPTSPYFGNVYVASGSDNSSSAFSGRTNVAGIYSLTADLQGVDLSDNSVVTDPNRTDYVGVGSFDFNVELSTPWMISLDDGGNVLVADRTASTGGVKFFSPDLQTSGLVLAGEGNAPGFNHSRVSGRVYSEGELGSTTNPLTIWGMDTELRNGSGGVIVAGEVQPGTAPSLWRWQVGDATESTVTPDLWIDTGAIPATANGNSNFLQFVGIRTNADYSPVTDKWYLTNNRSQGNEGGLVILSADGTTQTLEWSSFDTTIALGLDGQVGQQLVDIPETPEDESAIVIDTSVQDIIRSAQDVQVSDDGSTLYLYTASNGGGFFVDPNDPTVGTNEDNLHLGPDSDNPGRILVIPLDENGLPVIVLDENGTPGDTLDDQISNWKSISTPNNDGFAFRSPLEIDAAGNIYAGDDSDNANGDRVDVFSPGGPKTATTSYNADLTGGAFAVADGVIVPPAIPGDFDGDGDVDGADFGVFVSEFQVGDTGGVGAAAPFSDADFNSDGFVDGADFGVFVDGFQNFPPTPSAVPEPTTGLLAVLAGAAALAGRRR